MHDKKSKLKHVCLGMSENTLKKVAEAELNIERQLSVVEKKFKTIPMIYLRLHPNLCQSFAKKQVTNIIIL